MFFVFSATSGCQGLKASFTKRLKEFQSDNASYMNYFIGYIDQWGQAFKDDPGLLDIVSTTKESETSKDIEKLLTTDKNEVSVEELEAQKQAENN